jgi:ketosteroid isomerase-like protein
MRAAVIMGLLFVAGVLAKANVQSSNNADESRILLLENAWNKAEERKDVRALDELLANTLAYTDYDGTFMNKSQFLASVKDTTDKPEQIVNENVTVQVYGGSAVVAGAYHEKGTSRGKPYQRRGRFTDTWVNQNGTWQCVASQSTLFAH